MIDGRCNVSPIIRDRVFKILKLCKRLPLYAVGLYLFLLVLMIGVISIFKGQPFTNFTIFEIPIHEAWAIAEPSLLYFSIIASAVLAVVLVLAQFVNEVVSFNGIVLKDCDAYTYMVASKFGVAASVNSLSDIVFQSAYATALCLHGEFEEALEFVEPFKDDRKRKFIWLNVHLNTAESNEEFDGYYSQLKKKGLFELTKLYRDGKYEEVVLFVKDNIKMVPSYRAALGNFYLAKAYVELGELENAIVAVSGTVAESEYLPYLHKKALELYKSLNQKLVE